VNGFYVTGDADFVLYVTARTMEDYEEFIRKFFQAQAFEYVCLPPSAKRSRCRPQDDGRVTSDKGGLCRTDRVSLRVLIEISGFSKASRLTIAAATTITHIDFR